MEIVKRFFGYFVKNLTQFFVQLAVILVILFVIRGIVGATSMRLFLENVLNSLGKTSLVGGVSGLGLFIFQFIKDGVNQRCFYYSEFLREYYSKGKKIQDMNIEYWKMVLPRVLDKELEKIKPKVFDKDDKQIEDEFIQKMTKKLEGLFY